MILDITGHEYGLVNPLLTSLLTDVADLYQGEWPSHEACQTGYHNHGHAIDVALLTARMISGWNKLPLSEEHPVIDEPMFLNAIAAALFHDTGYIKEKGDTFGSGGKFSFSHEDRSMELAREYLTSHPWPERSRVLAPNIISTTKFHGPLQLEGLFANRQEEIIGRMVASADLVAQMADVDYIKRINDLYGELQEAYEVETREVIQAKGIRVFNSAQEMIEGTVDFYEKFVLPRLASLGRMDQYLVSFFGDGRNPYLENITANLSDQVLDQNSHWRRLGDVLHDRGFVSSEKLKSALNVQEQEKESSLRKRGYTGSLRQRLLAWMGGSQYREKCIGEILMEMKAIGPIDLRTGLLHQVLPEAMVNRLSRSELLYLLRIAMLLQSIGRGPWLFDQILEMTNELLDCEGSYILLANPENHEMLIAIPTGPNKDLLDGRTIPSDKGLAGWVYSHGQPARVSNVRFDDRFDSEVDQRVRAGFETRSVLAVPLHINGELIGVMEIINKKNGNFSKHDMEILTLLANVFAVSLDGVFRLQEMPS
ncbi:MAG: GAF domain-containing protein [Proteobacteria bacterium]|nr:GAF domain-containing protein [Pseudomonadota bacterium]MBU1686468.1 GAF domain-containing protein [Pseudomonadota bacterium]